MNHKKNAFFTFCCSLVPGAGEMYMGLYKQGISLMLMFWSVGGIGGWLNFELLWVVAPVIWFYSFFHSNNLRNMPEDEFLAQEDRYLVFHDFNISEADAMLKRNKKAVAVILIILGISIFIQIGMNMFSPFWEGIYWNMFRRFNRSTAQIIIAVLAILGGVHLFKEEKVEKSVEEKGA